MRRALCILSIPLLAACGPSGRGGNVEPADLMDWKGQHCRVMEGGTRVARTTGDWTALWAEIGQDAPPVDLNHHFAAAVFLGSRMTGGFRIEWLEPGLDGGRYRVPYRVREPEGFAIQVLTQPYAVRLIPKTALEIDVSPTP